LKQAQRLAAELRDLGETNADVPRQVLGWDAGGLTCWLLRAFTTGRVYLKKALALYDPADRASYAELLPTMSESNSGDIYRWCSPASEISIRHCGRGKRPWKRRAGSRMFPHWLSR
jgi:hypothetical protein